MVHRGLDRGSGRAVAEGLAPCPEGGTECGWWLGAGGEKGLPQKFVGTGTVIELVLWIPR